MSKESTATYVLTLQLKTEIYQESILNNRLEIGRKIYNAVLGEALKRYKTLTERKAHRKLNNEIKIAKKNKAEKGKEINKLYKEKNKLYEQFGLTEYSLINYVQPMYSHFKSNIDSKTGQATASRVWSAISKLISGDGEKLHFKRCGELNSLEGRWNKSGIKYDGLGNILWNGLTIPIVIKANDEYALQAIQDRVKYVRLKRVMTRGRYKYYTQLVLEGVPPKKDSKEIGTGNVGLDIGTQTIAISSEKKVKLLELCPKAEPIEKVKRKLLRKLDRQKRANNPENFNKDGTIKRGNILTWYKSNRYIKTQNELREVHRKQAAIRKLSHEKLANYIISLGNRILIENMNYKGLQKRAKNTTKNKKGKFNKKKRFGKSLANKAPSMLLSIIERKLKYTNNQLLKINTQRVKASQYNHFTGEYNKKELKDRWNQDIGIQRDLYSAFLIMNVNADLETVNQEECIRNYENFKKLHDNEVCRLKEYKASGHKLICSMGI